MRLDRIGLELEGGWDRSYGLKPNAEKIIGDISVKGLDSYHIGEIVSKPMAFEDWEAWLRINHPTSTHPSCGLHIHLSTKNERDMVKLLYRNFYENWLTEVTKWAKERFPPKHIIFKRLEGDPKDEYARFCQRRFSPSSQIRNTRKGMERRSHWNFCYSLHGTIECRVFPMFESIDESISAIKHTISFVEGFINRFRLKNLVVNRTIPMPEVGSWDRANKEIITCL